MSTNLNKLILNALLRQLRNYQYEMVLNIRELLLNFLDVLMECVKEEKNFIILRDVYIITKYPSIFLIIYLALRSASSEVIVATPVFFD